MLDEALLKQVMGSILKVNPESIGPESSSDTIEGWDSLKHMNLIIALEEEFGVSIPDEEVGNINSYKLISMVLNDLLKGE
jgi:acyl carrier protein